MQIKPIMSHGQDQLDEIEALESIYSEEINICGESPHEFTVPVKTENYDPDADEETGLYVLLRFRFTPKYPDEAPEIEIEDEENMERSHVAALKKYLEEQVEENLGMVMSFTIISAAIEWLGEKYDTIIREREEARQKQKDLEDEEERKKLEGTKVTIESFLAWKADYDAELLAKKGVKKEVKDGKLTGRELFTTDTSLNDSDIKFLASAGDPATAVVSVDESLFEDLDDLDLEDDDDPDWCPGDSD